MSISFFIKKKNKKKNTECLGFLAYLLFYCIFYMSISFFIIKKKKEKMNVLNSWHIYCFIVQETFMFFFHFLLVELVSDAALTSKLGMSTPTPIEVDG